MAEYKDREHYIPLRKSDLVDMLCRDLALDRAAAESFRHLGDMISATFHYEYYKLLEELKDEYAPFDPDSVTAPIVQLTAEQKEQKLSRLFDRLVLLMERANFKRLSSEDVDKAMTEVSEWGVNMSVDMALFERLEIYARGDTIGTRYVRRWPWIWKQETVRVPLFRRLVLFAKVKPSKRWPEHISTDNVFLKAFKEIPKADLEMLMPGAQLKMPGFQQLKLGGSLVSGGAGVGYTIVDQLMTGFSVLSHSPQILMGMAMALFGYGSKQFTTTKARATSSTSASRRASITRRSATTWASCSTCSTRPRSRNAARRCWPTTTFGAMPALPAGAAPDLDDYVEMDLERLAKLKVDFEIGDALAKLERLQLVTRNGENYVAVPIERALEVLDYAWDNYFKYNNEAQERAARGVVG